MGRPMAVLEVQSVSKAFRAELWSRRVMAVRELSFSLDREGIVGFVGPNGAGKTTTIKIVLGLMRPTSGTVTLYGRPALDPASRRAVAYVSEQPYFYTHLTVAESLGFIADLRGIARGSVAAEIRRVLDAVDLADASGRKVRELSKGMQQRLNMAQALMGDPELFIFDEPMSGMDPPGRSLFRRLFADLRRAGKTIFFSTHILEDVEALCDRVVVLSKGERTYDGPVADLLARGFEGTELAVSGLTAAARDELTGQGCTVRDAGPGLQAIFVPAGSDVHRAQDVVRRAGLYCESIVQRRKSLETLLYAQKGDRQ